MPFSLLGWRNGPNEGCVPLASLDQSPHDLAHVVVTLVQRHGGIVEQIVPGEDEAGAP